MPEDIQSTFTGKGTALGGSSKPAYRIIMGKKIPIRTNNEVQKPEVKNPTTNAQVRLPMEVQQKQPTKTNPPQMTLPQREVQPKPVAQPIKQPVKVNFAKPEPQV